MSEQTTLLTGNLRKTVFLLALPVLCEQFLLFWVEFFDTFLAGQLGTIETSAVGLSAYVSWLGSMMFSLVGTGTTALVSRHWGAGNREEANHIMNRSMSLVMVLGGGVYLLLYFGAPMFAVMLKLEGNAASVAVEYLRTDAVGHFFTGISLVGAAALRGTGNMKLPMLVLGTVSIFNVIASAAMVYGLGPIPEFKLTGIVYGTVFSRMIGCCLMLGLLWRGTSGLHYQPRQFRLRGSRTKRILKVGIPAAADGGFMWLGHFLFLMIVSNLVQAAEKPALAAHMIAVRIEAITYLPAIAWGYASASLIGQSLGAGDKERAIKTGHEAMKQCLIFAIACTLVFFFGADEIYQLMHTDKAVREIGPPGFRMVALFQIPLIISIIYVSSLRGAGDTVSPLRLTIFSMYCIRLPLAYYCGITLDGGLFGAWIGMCGDMLMRAILAAWCFQRAKWTETVV